MLKIFLSKISGEHFKNYKVTKIKSNTMELIYIMVVKVNFLIMTKLF